MPFFFLPFFVVVNASSLLIRHSYLAHSFLYVFDFPMSMQNEILHPPFSEASNVPCMIALEFFFSVLLSVLDFEPVDPNAIQA